MYLDITRVHRKWLDRAFWAEMRRRVEALDKYQQAREIREARERAA